jgi:hypothetical protein
MVDAMSGHGPSRKCRGAPRISGLEE